MSRTEELLKLCKVATCGPWVYHQTDTSIPTDIEITTADGNIGVAEASQWDAPFIAACNPETIKQLVELCRLQHEALKYAADKVYSEQNDDEIGEAIAAFNKFEGGE